MFKLGSDNIERPLSAGRHIYCSRLYIEPPNDSDFEIELVTHLGSLYVSVCCVDRGKRQQPDRIINLNAKIYNS